MPKRKKRAVRTRRGIREYTYLGCPLTKSRSAWCFRLCTPDEEGKGQCGRVAPHSITSRIQRAIAEHKKGMLAAHLEELEAAYLAHADNQAHDPGLRVSEGESEVVFHLEDPGESDGPPLSPALAFKAMHDSAHLAVASLVEDGDVATREFTLQMGGDGGAEVLVARSLFVGMEDERFLVECVLHDAEGSELGRATGVFVAGG